MKRLDAGFSDDFCRRLNAIRHVGVDTSNQRFAPFVDWFTEHTARSIAVTYLSNVSRQMSARLGAALMRTPDVIVVLADETWTDPQLARLEKIVDYVGGLRAIIACSRRGDEWAIDSVVGQDYSQVRHELTHAFPNAKGVSVRRRATE